MCVPGVDNVVLRAREEEVAFSVVFDLCLEVDEDKHGFSITLNWLRLHTTGEGKPAMAHQRPLVS